MNIYILTHLFVCQEDFCRFKSLLLIIRILVSCCFENFCYTSVLRRTVQLHSQCHSFHHSNANAYGVQVCLLYWLRTCAFRVFSNVNIFNDSACASLCLYICRHNLLPLDVPLSVTHPLYYRYTCFSEYDLKFGVNLCAHTLT